MADGKFRARAAAVGLLLPFLCIYMAEGLSPQLNKTGVSRQQTRTVFFTVNDVLTQLDSDASGAGPVSGGSAGVGRWTPWQYCPRSSYVNQLQVQSNANGDLVTGLRLRCAYVDGEGGQANANGAASVHYINVNYENEGEGARDRQEEDHDCQARRRAIGFRLGLNSRNGTGVGARSSSSAAGLLHTIDLYCLSRDESLSHKYRPRFNSKDDPPQLCERGEYICGVHAKMLRRHGQEIVNGFGVRCCRDPAGQPAFITTTRDNRNAPGTVFSTRLARKDAPPPPEFDFPYWQGWRFCPPNGYVVGMQLALTTRSLRLLCAPAADLNAVEALGEKDSYEDELYTRKKMCVGFGVGYQVEANPVEGVNNVRLFCSGAARFTLQTYVDEVGFKVREGRNETFVSSPFLCRRNQAICGIKMEREELKPLGSNEWRLRDLKLKCCDVPDVAAICTPTDEYQLLVECDASEALADTTCSYKKRIGRTVSNTLSRNERVERDVREGLSYERRLSVAKSESISQSSSNGTSNAQGSSAGGSNTETLSVGNTTGQSSGQSESVSSTDTTSQSTSDSKTEGAHSSSSHSTGHSESQGSDHTTGTMKADSSNWRHGTLESSTISNGLRLTRSQSDSVSSSQGEESSLSFLQGVSSSDSRSQSSSRTDRESENWSDSNTESATQSHSRTQGTHYESSVTAGVSVGFFGIGASLSTSMSRGGIKSSTTGSERTSSSTSQSGGERGTDRTQSSGREQTTGTNTQRTQTASRTSTTGRGHETSQGTDQTSNTDRSSSVSGDVGGDSSRQTTDQRTSSQSSSSNTQDTTEEGSTSSQTSGTDSSQSHATGTGSERTSQNSAQSTVDTTRGSGTSWSSENSATSNAQATRENTAGQTTSSEQSGGGTANTGLTTGYEWSPSSSEVFNEETEVEVHLTVPAGMVTKLYQVVGHCAYYVVRANVFKRVDAGEALRERLAAVDELVQFAGSCDAELSQCKADLTETSEKCVLNGTRYDFASA